MTSSNPIAAKKVVAFDYVLKDESGMEMERSESAMVYLHGANNILRGLEEALAGYGEGDQVAVTLPPEKAYGLPRPDALQRVPIKHLLTKSKKYKPGQIVAINTQDGRKDAVIVKVGRFNLDLDMNHPFAGKTLTFEVSIGSVRDATAEELSHGHAHGPGGHHGH
ncbi:MAG: FKBP-type peptidyl-prolyl cis-trans isomerase SlyD [Candidatus Azotimanducaceae bacterium]|jgi:FKBP-type peptidyl-prolyl cis-trans isomerase SlyD